MPDRWTVRECPSCGGVTNVVRLHVAQTSVRCPNCVVPLGEPFEVVRAKGARTSDPVTSKLAALKQEPRRGSQRAEALAAIRLSRHDGMTAAEVESYTAIKGVWKRISELKQGGHIVAAGTRPNPVTGAEAEVYVAAEYKGTLF